MTTFKEKVSAYVGRVIVKYWHDKDMDFDASQFDVLGKECRDAYLAGAKEAFASQWRSVEDGLPEDEEYVLIDGPRGIEPAVWNERHQVWDDAEGDDYMYEEDAVRAWMPIPEPPKPNNHADKT